MSEVIDLINRKEEEYEEIFEEVVSGFYEEIELIHDYDNFTDDEIEEAFEEAMERWRKRSTDE